ncbi:hypothetical protein [Pseudoalteromonas sp. T1lg10]|uniref:hypothetical protein n=1 Tax=Pseudoalteromonas sp. T1lg10 TaxID=2077093 RepID=UPI000CF70D9E|nr:hypothetical protein [Pseudoalteromonas sp. T1lg10]
MTITTTATKRYDYSVYLPEGAWSAQEFNTSNTCSVLLGQNDDPGVDLEDGLDACADIGKGKGLDETHLYEEEVITMFCRDDDDSGKAEFNYCMAWHNKEDADCSINDPAAPGTPSKCRCDSFDIDVFIKPKAPAIQKTLVGTSTHTEPGGVFTYTLSFTNPNTTPAPGQSIFLTELSDWIDKDADGSYETEIDLWGATTTVDGDTAEGVYLTSSTCQKPAEGESEVEVFPGSTYSCAFSVHIVDGSLPTIPTAQKYNDLIAASLEDKNGAVITDGDEDPTNDSCYDKLAAAQYAAGDHCSPERQVTITNLPPTINVTKTADVEQVPESGGDVVFTVVVSNTSDDWDSPVTLTYLVDDMFGDLNGKGDCATGGTISNTTDYTCSFTENLDELDANSDDGDPLAHTNVVTAKATDDEGDEATDSDSETVMISNVPSEVDLQKDANPETVAETGDDPTIFRDIDYTFTFSVAASGNDTVTFDELDDDMFGDLTDSCIVDMFDDGEGGGLQPIADDALNDGFDLAPGQSASCTITLQVQGLDGDSHVNLATIYGTDEDGDDVSDSDDATVTFTPLDASAAMKFVTSSLVVVEINNGGVRNANLTSLQIWDGTDIASKMSVFANPDVVDEFRVLNNGGSHFGHVYLPCVSNTLLGYSGIATGTDTYTCAFTIEWYPDLEDAAAIDITKAIEAVLTDTAGDTAEAQVSIKVITVQ